MKTFQHEIIINAPAEKVWAVLAAFPFYPEWNPFIRSIIGKVSAGERLKLTAKLDGFPEIIFHATVMRCEPPLTLGWQAIFIKGIFEAYHSFAIEVVNLGQCRFLHSETFSGILTSPVLFLLEGRFREGYQTMNEALKARAEADLNKTA
ncbi:MAG: SRPBCC domain-containing protein [Chlorobium sp.]|nr:MAG: SRPBCC domain-containing protein [Chlorobium sp.]